MTMMTFGVVVSMIAMFFCAFSCMAQVNGRNYGAAALMFCLVLINLGIAMMHIVIGR